MISIIGTKKKIKPKNNNEIHYFNELGLKKEPFSTSPDPYFFFPIKNQKSCLTHIEISIRLRRGASLILGEIGTGKTTLCRTLIQNMESDPSIEVHLILNPAFQTEEEFLKYLLEIFKIPVEKDTAEYYLSKLKNYLFTKGVEENKTIVLLIDEAQKLTINAIECLRMLLNFETNEFKLLQLILFGQLELKDKLKLMPNFVDRITYITQLNPIPINECEELIEFRLIKSGFKKRVPIFTKCAIEAIHEVSDGYPRKICMAAHTALEQLVISNRKNADRSFIQSLFC